MQANERRPLRTVPSDILLHVSPAVVLLAILYAYGAWALHWQRDGDGAAFRDAVLPPISVSNRTTMLGNVVPAWQVDAQENWPLWIKAESFLPLMGLNGVFVYIFSALRRRSGDVLRLRTFVLVVGLMCVAVLHGFLGGLVLLGLCTLNFLFASAAKRWRSAWHHYSVWILVLITMEVAFRFLGDRPACQHHASLDSENLLVWGKCASPEVGTTVLVNPIEHRFPALAGVFITKGLLPWRCYRFMALKLISYNFDVYWFYHGKVSKVRNLDKKPELLQLTERNLPCVTDYGFLWYMAYVVYFPLYIVGPVLSFNAFVWQMMHAQSTYTQREVVKYVLRTAAYIVALEVFLSIWWFPSVIWKGGNPELFNVNGWLTLVSIHSRLVYEWMCLLIIWRTSRGFSLLCGIDSPENMVACIFTLTSFEQFWRVWHSSLNRWVLRYLYTPVGGRRCTGIAVPLTFAFVAYWHDGNGLFSLPEWYAWGALNAVGVILEKAMDTGTNPLANAVGGSVTVLGIIAANSPALLANNTLEFYSTATRQWFTWCCYAVSMLGMRSLDTYLCAAPPPRAPSLRLPENERCDSLLFDLSEEAGPGEPASGSQGHTHPMEMARLSSVGTICSDTGSARQSVQTLVSEAGSGRNTVNTIVEEANSSIFSQPDNEIASRV
eukprot:TRINITY_DN7206_c0_g1_i3.p1 TRINITY_DN7206_c0_g1~~TRINITY_DN7206_c0_g1_i3.p1  ORF type:complete len:685 (+),score=85.27 TRINITY_DN7206_c0_g1_i3:68-2056(+)